jgi:hypothetical protein
MSTNVRREAAAILRRLADALPRAGGIAIYLRGHADGLDARTPPQRRRQRA